MLDSLFSRNAVQLKPDLRAWTDDPNRHHEVKPGTTIIPIADEHGRVGSLDPSRSGSYVLHAPGQEPFLVDPAKADMSQVKEVSRRAAALSSDRAAMFRAIGEGVSATVSPAPLESVECPPVNSSRLQAPEPVRTVPSPVVYKPADAAPPYTFSPPESATPAGPPPPNVDPAALAYLMNFFKAQQAPVSPQVARPWEYDKPAAPAPPSGLGLPFLGPHGEPSRPSVDVTVALPSMGSLRVRFHEVVDHPDAVVFVYDTRYPDGSQWAPPADLEQVFVVECPSRSVRAKVRGGSVNFRLGPLELTVMVKEGHDA